ncbi:deleted in malignant brain tumors 1 protein-like [Simochromis diagramma]|uniref:deleted in malignant brain tumors 1 protein-like n=1 Tax=Simochromis diagramma TaxID=43689 RepID=UPI001A7ECCF1|nr:deleted in malignant brain tumors 1 protein-like [Simochromis diagramma]
MWTQQTNFFFLATVSCVSAAAGPQFRLAGSGLTPCSGRVEIYHNGSWGTICDYYWDLNDAEVVCRQLDCGTALRATTNAHFGEGTGPIWLRRVNCSGHERSLSECDLNRYWPYCGHSEDAGVICSGPQVRLAGSGSTPCSGRVEIYHNGSWGTICDDYWDLNDAEVVCRQLDCGTALRATTNAHFGGGTGPIWLRHVGCNGSESSLSECDHGEFGAPGCGHSEDAGVLCSGPQVRLAGSGSTPCSGRVEIYHNGSWGTICDDYWDLNDAEVVCRQLDCGTALRATTNAHFGGGTGPIWLRHVNCSGHERSLSECDLNRYWPYCGHSEDAGVLCSESLQQPRIHLRYDGGHVQGHGSAEITGGSSFEFTCSINSSYTPDRFRLFFYGSSQMYIEPAVNHSASFSFPAAEYEHRGNYSCVYEINVSSRTFTSPESAPIHLIITYPLQQPSISLTSPNGGLVWGPEGAEITKGSSFVFSCSINSRYTPGRFRLFFSGVNLTEPAVNHSASFSFPAAEYEHRGNYSCVYELLLPSRTFTSPESAPIHLIITYPLQQPSISLTSPNGGLVWGPEGAEITKGSSFVFSCSINSRYTPGRFRLFFSGVNLTEPAVNHSASFSFPAAEYEHRGNYSCVYELLLPSRTFTSPESAPIHLIITFPWWLLVASAVPGILVLLLVVCLVLWRRRRARRFDPHVPIQSSLVAAGGVSSSWDPGAPAGGLSGPLEEDDEPGGLIPRPDPKNPYSANPELSSQISMQQPYNIQSLQELGANLIHSLDPCHQGVVKLPQ